MYDTVLYGVIRLPSRVEGWNPEEATYLGMWYMTLLKKLRELPVKTSTKSPTPCGRVKSCPFAIEIRIIVMIDQTIEQTSK